MFDSRAHWEAIYGAKSSKEVSWYAPHLEKSLELILGLGLAKNAAIIDVGGGASTLPDDLLFKGFNNITVLDVSSAALKGSKDRLGEKAGLIHWLEADITQALLGVDHYDLWHDRAVFHFLTKPEDRQRYVKNLTTSIKNGAYFLIATFGPNGPLKCSGLEIVRYSPEALQSELGKAFRLEKHFLEIHDTPFGTRQEFLHCLFRKIVGA